jgi:hypothetical protein
MELLEKNFKVHSSDVVDALKMMQGATRMLQRLCSHLKDEKKDARIMAFVPTLKRCMETLVYRTKGMLAANDCADVRLKY